MKIYMIGIGGIGMSALAQLYLARGDRVSGYDREHGPTTDLLEGKGVQIHFGAAMGQVPGDTDLVVYSDAIVESHPERAHARELRKIQKSYFEALGDVSSKMTTIAVSGTHGKTTTTAMLTKILRDTGHNPTAVIGSLVKDFGSNFVEGSKDLFVVEACEYRDHLLEIDPKILVITNLEWDHTDWFKTEEQLCDTFRKAVQKVPADGVIVTDPAAPHMQKVLRGVQARIVDYSQIEVHGLQLIGEFNRNNARAAKAAALALVPDLAVAAVDQSLQTFKGTWRRFEHKGHLPNGAEVYDDYAHHPTAIRSTIRGARERFPGKEILVVFHPHLYSRTRDLFADFVQELSQADSVVLAPIYAAREPDNGEVSSDSLAQAIVAKNKNVVSLLTFDAIEEEVRKQAKQNTIVITMGAGDIYKVADKLVV